MSKIDINNLKWDTDLKRILLGDNYDETNPIKNILMGKLNQYYMDSPNDYYKNSIGHLENYQVVEDVFEKLTNDKDTGFKDIMNSFWMTYKCLLQIEYPEIFRPVGSLRKNNKLPLERPNKDNLQNVQNGFPPSSSKHYTIVHSKYIEYYEKNFPMLELRNKQYLKELTWVDFLLVNFDEFKKVNENIEELKIFAKLTHTIGNITVVPPKLNNSRANYDYWDYGLKKLIGSFETEKEFICYRDIFIMHPFLKLNNTPIPLQSGHFEKKGGTLPQNRQVAIDFLRNVNQKIEVRGLGIIASIQ